MRHPKEGFCGSCGEALEDGDCPFCERFEEVMSQEVAQ